MPELLDHPIDHPIDSARLAWWLTAWLRGGAAPDDLVEAVRGADAAHDVAGLPGDPGPVPLVLALGRLRGLGVGYAGLALPVDGDPVGLGGPPAFNSAALEAGEAVVLGESGGSLGASWWGLVPHRAGAGVLWHAQPAARRPLPDLGEADRDLRRALSEAATALADLDVARWRPEVAEELVSLRRPWSIAAPPGVPPRCVEVTGRALQAAAITDLALADDGGAVSASAIGLRRAALLPLDRAARRALVAAASPEAWPEPG